MTEAEIEAWFERLSELVKPYLIAKTGEPLEVILGNLLKSKGQTIATAESCTGGKLASLLNKHAGSSAFYFGSIISYDNSVKEHLLGVPEEMIKAYGVVSEEVVRVMAETIRKQIGTDYGIATSGIAGPTGGSKEKPVGTVWIAWATPKGTEAECFHLGKLREQITDRACVKALIGMIRRVER
jgi:nicotinamide-nucleotide amidase